MGDADERANPADTGALRLEIADGRGARAPNAGAEDGRGAAGGSPRRARRRLRRRLDGRWGSTSGRRAAAAAADAIHLDAAGIPTGTSGAPANGGGRVVGTAGDGPEGDSNDWGLSVGGGSGATGTTERHGKESKGSGAAVGEAHVDIIGVEHIVESA